MSQKIHLYMKAADVVTLPYRDVLSVALTMSFGKACIAPARGCIRETITPEGEFLYDRQDTPGLPKAVREAIDRRTELGEMGRWSHQRTEQWTWDNVAAATAAVYRRARGEREGGAPCVSR